MKPEAQKILTMIEGVGPVPALEHQNDMKKYLEILDEIDVRVDFMARKIVFNEQEKDLLASLYVCSYGPKFTRSIDAQEALRREGWYVRVRPLLRLADGIKFQVFAERNAAAPNIAGGFLLHTEPLARLHAWVGVWRLS